MIDREKMMHSMIWYKNKILHYWLIKKKAAVVWPFDRREERNRKQFIKNAHLLLNVKTIHIWNFNRFFKLIKFIIPYSLADIWSIQVANRLVGSELFFTQLFDSYQCKVKVSAIGNVKQTKMDCHETSENSAQSHIWF